jgi:hypothetical protein
VQWQRNTAELGSAWLARAGLTDADLPGGLKQAAERERLVQRKASAQTLANIQEAGLLMRRASAGLPRRREAVR